MSGQCAWHVCFEIIQIGKSNYKNVQCIKYVKNLFYTDCLKVLYNQLFIYIRDEQTQYV